MNSQRRVIPNTLNVTFHDIVRPRKKQRLGGTMDVVSVLADIGAANYSRGDYKAANECFNQALSNINNVDNVWSFSPIGSKTTTTRTSIESMNCLLLHQEKEGKSDKEEEARGNIEYDEGMRMYRNLLQIKETTSLEEATAILFFNAAQTNVEMGLFKQAKSCFFISLDKFNALGSNLSDPLYTVMSLHSLGYCFYRVGREENANCFYQRALTYVSERELGMFHLAASFNCAGVCLFNQQKHGNTDLAMEMFVKSLSLHKSCDEPDMSSMATVLNNIGRVHYLRSDYEKARNVYKEGLLMRMDELGNKSTDVAATAYNLGQTCYQLGRLDDALLHYHQFLSIMLSVASSTSKDIALVYKGIAEIHQDKRDFKMALQYLQKALEIQKACAKGLPCSDVAATLNRMGNLWYELKDFKTAMEHYQEGLAVEKATLDPNHPHIIVTVTNIGHIFKQQGDFENALREYERVYKLQLEKFGQDNFVLADTLSSLGLMQYHLRQYDISFDSYQEALRIRRQHIGTDDHPEIASTLNSIGLVLFKQEMFELAKNCFMESLRIRTKLLGKDHRDVAILWYNIATIHFETGEDELAIQMYKETLRVERHTLGEDHPDVVLTLQHLGQVHQQLGYSEKAIQYFQEALTIERKRKEPIQRSQARILNLLGNVYLQIGKTSPMMECYVEAARAYESNQSFGETLVIGGYNFYGLSKTNPPCASVA